MLALSVRLAFAYVRLREGVQELRNPHTWVFPDQIHRASGTSLEELSPRSPRTGPITSGEPKGETESEDGLETKLEQLKAIKVKIN